MRKFFSKIGHSLIWRFVLILLIPVVLMLAVMGIQLMRINENLAADRQRYCEDIHSSIEQQIVGEFESIEKTVSALVQSATVQEYFSIDLDYQQKIAYLSSIKDLIRLSSRFNTEMIDVLFYYDGGSTVESMIGYSPKEVRKFVSEAAHEMESESINASRYYIVSAGAGTSATDSADQFVVQIAPIFDTVPIATYSKRIGYVSVVSTARDFNRILSVSEDVYSELRGGEADSILLSGAAAETKNSNAQLIECASDLPYGDFTLVTYCRAGFDLSDSTVVPIVISVLFIIGYLLFVAMAVGRLVLRPVRRINSEVEEIGGKNPNMRLSIAPDDEIGSIAVHINRMLDSIARLNENVLLTQKELYEAQIERSRSQLYAFQSQVAPHFLFNTLQCIRSKAFLSKVPEIAQMCADVSTTLRYILNSSETVTLEQELNISKRYLKIVAIRFQNKITYEINVADDVDLQYMIPKMILQPLVENAVYHGLEPKQGSGHLVIDVRKDGEHLEIALTDNGIGMGPDTLKKLQDELRDPIVQLFFTSGGDDNIGLHNVHNRIRLRFGNEFGLSITCDEQGTKVLIRLP
jgi:signal transduction histidine kinase/capsular polysaccharide biosynthesis protein